MSSAWKSTPRASRLHSRWPHGPSPAARSVRACAITNRYCWPRIAAWLTPQQRAAPSRRPPNGCSTTTTSSKSRSGEIREDLPPGYYRQLPKLAGGPLRGYPRVFGLAWAFVAHTDSRFDPEALRRFVRAYQRVQPLTIGELWAVAITLRIVLVENLRRAAERIVSNRDARQEADARGGPTAGRQRPDGRAGYHCGSSSRSAARLPAGLRRAAGAAAARSGPAGHAGAAVAGGAPERAGTRPPSRSCATSISGRAPRTSRCATSSPACG